VTERKERITQTTTPTSLTTIHLVPSHHQNVFGNHHVLTTWEFGKAKLWHLNSGTATELPDVKTQADGVVWQIRPGTSTPPLFALLSRTFAEDHLALHFTSVDQAPALIKLATTDAQAISWSPDGRWLAVLDVPTATPNIHIYTPDGHLFRSCPSTKGDDDELGVKDMAWSPDGSALALARYDGRIELLDARTFSPLATIEHNTTIDQNVLSVNERAPVWQENVSVTNERTYSFAAQPLSPPLSRTKPSSDPVEQGIAEIAYSCNGHYLATRDCRMLNTVWIWNLPTLSAHAILVQHSNVRSLVWHPTRAESLMIDCAEGIVHLFDVSSSEPPRAHHTNCTPAAKLSWMYTSPISNLIVMVSSRSKFELLYPEGRNENDEATRSATPPAQSTYEEGASEDSLFEVLSGRKPLPPKTEPSYTERVDLDVESEDTEQGALEDTFREKHRPLAEELDPLDDSQIF
jgi:WD40 repeat protein